MEPSMKNTIIGAIIGGVVVAGGYTLFSGSDEKSASPSRTDNPTQTRTSLPTGEADKDCKDFKTQREAQAFFEANDPSNDPHGLDRDEDGKVCETLP